MHRQRLVVLGNLIALGQDPDRNSFCVRTRDRRDRAVQRHRALHRQFHGFPAEDRQSAGQSQAYGTHIGIGCGAELHRATAEDLGARAQLHVHFQPDHRLVFRDQFGRREVRGDSRHSFTKYQ